MNPLIREAVAITKDLGDVTFIGAVAVLLHIGGGRESQDLDFAVLTPMTKEDLENKGYFTRIEKGKDVTRSPRGYKIDIYSKRPIKGVQIEAIVDTASSTNIRSQIIRFANLDILIVLKYRAGRTQDNQDLQTLVQGKFEQINWNVIEELTSKVEYQDLKNTMLAFRDILS